MSDDPLNKPSSQDEERPRLSIFDTSPLGDPPGEEGAVEAAENEPGSPDRQVGAAYAAEAMAQDAGGDTPPGGMAAVALDVHSQPVSTPTNVSPRSAEEIRAEEVAAQQKAPIGELTPPAQAAQVVVDTAKQAAQQAQVVVDTAKQATQQVAAAVQQGAQKITVAPRKALYRGKRFMMVYGGMVGAAGILAFLARKHRYFVGDVGITRAIQAPRARIYDKMMYAVSELGWRWISVGTRASASALMWGAGFRMESAFTVSTWTGDILTVLFKTRVLRPRPTKDLVRVVSDLEEASFPSGHVVHYVTFYGFMYYLVFTHLKQRWFRTAILSVLAGIILLIGPSRIYMGHHWPSDVGGAYLVGTLWLGVIIIGYIETKANYSLHTTPPFFVKRPKQLG